MRENISKALEELVGEVMDVIGIVCLRFAFGVQFWIEFIQVGARLHSFCTVWNSYQNASSTPYLLLFPSSP